jgi:hypothetical protein
MDIQKATERRQDSARNGTKLDERYGKIGISAVAAAAAAVSHKGIQRSAREARQYTAAYDRD